MATSNNFIQKQIAFQKAISKLPNKDQQNRQYDLLSERLKNIVRHNAELDANRIDRSIAKDKYQGEPKLYQEAVRDTYESDNRHCREINNTMLAINKTCDVLKVDKIFPAACENYSYDQIEETASQYIKDLRTVNELTHNYEKQCIIEQEDENTATKHNNLPRKTKPERGTENIVDDVIESINKEIGKESEF